jgi:hypothetical protein
MLDEGGNICRVFRKTVKLEIERRIVESSTGLLKVSDWTLGRRWPPPKRKKRLRSTTLGKEEIAVRL